MNSQITPSQGYLFLLIFGLAMLLFTWFFSRNRATINSRIGFLKAGSKVNWILGSISIAASWIWAPALFVSVQKSYEFGMAGWFWFTIPNVIALALFAILAPKIRDRLPGGYTLPDWIRYRFKNVLVHKIFLIIYSWYQVMAVTVQVFVGGLLLSYLTGIPLNGAMISLAVIGLSYSLLSGLRASILTDSLQMVLIVGIGAVIVPWAVNSGGGWDAVKKGFDGVNLTNGVFDFDVAYSFGIVTSIGLLSGAICDQQYWQRSFSIKREGLRKSFIVGGILFGIVPTGLALLGFLGANPDLGITMPGGVNLPMIGVEVVQSLLPPLALILFVIMLLSGLTSTLDSGLLAGASLWSIDFQRRSSIENDVFVKNSQGIELAQNEQDIIKKIDQKASITARIGMIVLVVIGLAIAMAIQYIPGFGLDNLWWVFNGVATMVIVPTILSLFWNRLGSKGVISGFVGSFIGICAFIYGNAVGDNDTIVISAIFIVVISLIMNLSFPAKRPFEDRSLD